jgi:hypothetical protein
LCADLKVIWTHLPFAHLILHHVGIPRSTSALECER